jgi:hypothetical protein
MCGCSSKCKDKKCKKTCTILTYYYDKANQYVSTPVQDTYTKTGGGNSFSVFAHGNLYYDETLISKVGTVEITTKVLQTATTQSPVVPPIEPPIEPPLEPRLGLTLRNVPPTSLQVVSNVTVLLPDGKTSLSFQYIYINSLPVTPPGIYKSICYSTTGLYYDKTCSVTLTVPQEGSVFTFEIKIYDRK